MVITKGLNLIPVIRNVFQTLEISKPIANTAISLLNHRFPIMLTRISSVNARLRNLSQSTYQFSNRFK